jgi:hypothetical protein
MNFTVYGAGWQCISYADLLKHAREHKDLMARAENSGCEGCYIEVARWNQTTERWERYCFEKVFGGEHSEKADARVSSFETAQKFADEINDAACCHPHNYPWVHYMPNWGSPPIKDKILPHLKEAEAFMSAHRNKVMTGSPVTLPSDYEAAAAIRNAIALVKDLKE